MADRSRSDIPPLASCWSRCFETSNRTIKSTPVVPEPRSAYALQFFLLSTTLLAIAIATSRMLMLVIPGTGMWRGNPFSPAFGISTLMLFMGSWCLFQAIQSVRRERQRLFRRWLRFALAAGTVFVAVQTFALSRFMTTQSSDDAETGIAAFVAMAAGLHGMHFVVALLFLCFISVQAWADRYDHEYYWGVTICAWFWHALGIIWVAILTVMMIVKFFSERWLA